MKIKRNKDETRGNRGFQKNFQITSQSPPYTLPGPPDQSMHELAQPEHVQLLPQPEPEAQLQPQHHQARTYFFNSKFLPSFNEHPLNKSMTKTIFILLIITLKKLMTKRVFKKNLKMIKAKSKIKVRH